VAPQERRPTGDVDFFSVIIEQDNYSVKLSMLTQILT
jgi:hypothetical protein